MAVAHSLAVNQGTDNIIVEVRNGQGLSGWGEGVPRDYVTGETVAGSLDFLRTELLPGLLGQSLEPGQALGPLPAGPWDQNLRQHPAAACALELALLDLAGQELGLSLSSLLGVQTTAPLVYSGIVPLAPPPVTKAILEATKALGLTQVKVKVGQDDDLARLTLVRQALGPQVRLRLDANGAWNPEQAVRRIQELEALDIESVEQPVPGGDLAGLLEVSRRVETLVMADESASTLEQAQAIADSGARVALNLRLSKCGGIRRTRQILDLARAAGLPCQLGCQVGELGILSAAGRHFAAAAPDLTHLEGSLTSFFLDRDVIQGSLAFGPGGLAQPLAGPGLGVRVLPARLEGCLAFSI